MENNSYEEQSLRASEAGSHQEAQVLATLALAEEVYKLRIFLQDQDDAEFTRELWKVAEDN